MQAVAQEMNLSETAFLVPELTGSSFAGSLHGSRWSSAGTPRLHRLTSCGNRDTWETGERARFFTKSGTLTAEKEGGWISMDFPEEPDQPAAAPNALAEALGIRPRYVGKNRLITWLKQDRNGKSGIYRLDFRRLAEVPARGIIVTAPADTGEFDFVSRFFAPAVGVDEDPVTGSATAALGRSGKKAAQKRVPCTPGV